jgi:hypothetical protein
MRLKPRQAIIWRAREYQRTGDKAHLKELERALDGIIEAVEVLGFTKELGNKMEVANTLHKRAELLKESTTQDKHQFMLGAMYVMQEIQQKMNSIKAN